MGIIKSILDTDLYKFTTSYAYSKLFPRAWGEFQFFDRDNTYYPQGFNTLLEQEIQKMSTLYLKDEEAIFLKEQLPYLPPFYIDFLKGFRFNPQEITIKLDNGKLQIKATGLLYRITFWETPLLAIVSELYFRVMKQTPNWNYVQNTTLQKANLLNQNEITFSIFGMRRRFSFEVEDKITSLLKEYAPQSLYGTSNVYLAFKHQLKVSGTHPHEWVQFHGALYGYKMANYVSMENWINVYDGDLGTVLTDTYTTDVFFKNFSKKHASLFTSLRHDSGCPFTFTDKALQRYEELRINPKQKYLVFSDSLDVEKILSISLYCKNKIGATFGIGTNLTCDVGLTIKPRNIVMKLCQCKITEKADWQECIKLSDVDGKHLGTPQEIKLAQQTLQLL